jgi:Family of unknown function (DUF5317)
MLTIAVVVTVAAAIAVLRGGSLQALAATQVRWLWIVYAAFAVQLGAALWSPDWLGDAGALFIVLGSNAAIGAFLLLNRSLPGTAIAAVGIVLNIVVISANGAMPVSARAIEIANTGRITEESGVKHERLDDDTILPWLADVIPVPPLRTIISVGDIVLALGIGYFVFVRTMSGGRDERPLETTV